MSIRSSQVIGPRGGVSSSVGDRDVGDAGYREVLAPVLETPPLGPKL